MKLNPISKQEADAQSNNLWPAGDYDFEVREADETESKSGNEMFALQVFIFNTEGRRKLCFDYLVNAEKSAWKIRHFAESCGLLASYESGVLGSNEMIGRTGRCTVGVQQAKDGYEAKNTIRDYLKDENAAAAERRKVPLERDLDDEIPF